MKFSPIPRGFCAGVERAIAIVERALEKFGAPIYVRHEVSAQQVRLRRPARQGAVFVEELDEVPAGAPSSSAPTASQRPSAPMRKPVVSKVFDATCPLVTKVHVEVGKMRKGAREVVMIGHKGHPEVEGTMGQSEGDVSGRYRGRCRRTTRRP